MKRLGLAWHSPGALLFTVVVLVAGPVLYRFLPATGVPTAIALGMIAVIVIKHFGVLAILLAPLYALRRRFRRWWVDRFSLTMASTMRSERPDTKVR